MGVVLAKRIYRFGLFEADAETGKLLREGVRVKLQDQPFRVLCLLLERAGEVVSREELRQALWPADTYVEFDGSLNAALKRLRYALGDSAENPVFVETIPKRGYRFLAPVTTEEPPASGPQIAVPAENLPEVLPGEVDNETAASAAAGPEVAGQPSHWRRTLIATGGAVALALLGVASYHRFTSGNDRAPMSNPRAARKTIAVLPFANEGAGPDFDYLRYAIANDLVTDLTYVPSVTVRPFASTSKYGEQPPDLAALGKELRVTYVLAGGFLRDQQNLQVNLELVDVAENQTVWRDEVTVAPQELVALHDKLEASTSQRLLPAMKIANATGEQIPRPNNEEAFELFLHSLAYPLDPGPNRLAVKALEGSVSLDSRYAPAWDQLSWRYYIDERYGNGGAAAAAKAAQAYERQRELDPSAPPISTTLRTEEGDLNGAYDQAAEFLRRRPDSSMAHIWMGYVLRYAGLLDEAGRECDAAFALDPGFNVLRSCATTFGMAGDYAHAEKYIKVDEGSGFAALSRMEIALRTRDTAAALAQANATGQLGYRNVNAELARLYLSHPSAAELAKAVAEVEADPVSSRDPELLYRNAEALAFCEQPDAALRQLSKAIKGNYCSYPAMEKDPLFDPIRQRAEFSELRQAAVRCQEDFLAHRERVDAALGPVQ